MLLTQALGIKNLSRLQQKPGWDQENKKGAAILQRLPDLLIQILSEQMPNGHRFPGETQN